jgi:hypothetical protein
MAQPTEKARGLVQMRIVATQVPLHLIPSISLTALIMIAILMKRITETRG